MYYNILMITAHDYKYCPSCGSNEFAKKEKYLYICPNCDLHFYINPKPTNAIILRNNKGEILFAVRKHDPFKGKWDLAGGFVDPKETLEESVIREVKEELSIDITDFKYVSSFHETYEHGGINSETICFVFEGIIPEGANIIPSDDAESVTFFKPADIPYEDMAFEGMKKVVKDYADTLKI